MNNKIIRIFIPVVAVVIIFESVMLVSSLDKNTSFVSKNIPKINKTNVVKEEPKLLNLALTPAEVGDMKVGKKYKVSLDLTPNSSFSLNALDLFVKFDPEMVTISDLVAGKELTKPDFMKVSDKKDVIATNFLFTSKDGMSFVEAKKINVLTFMVTPKKEGNTYFEISTGDVDGNSVTMFIDKVTSKGLPFSSNKLEVNLMK